VAQAVPEVDFGRPSGSGRIDFTHHLREIV
jgi:hypothetical protein